MFGLSKKEREEKKLAEEQLAADVKKFLEHDMAVAQQIHDQDMARIKEVGGQLKSAYDRVLTKQEHSINEKLQAQRDAINKDSIERMLKTIKDAYEMHLKDTKEYDKFKGSMVYERAVEQHNKSLPQSIGFTLKLHKVGTEIKHPFLEQLLALIENKNGLGAADLANAIIEACRNYFSPMGDANPGIPVGKGSR
ncbi:MAG: hypothetical protein FWE17_00215 [Alphaproteobacteria bacterium]|nr:hypothetical protein [Alphaproteobacteria bacterium]MCL2757729.1 hypothetical protein [Alphaproteobacteria bacterium]